MLRTWPVFVIIVVGFASAWAGFWVGTRREPPATQVSSAATQRLERPTHAPPLAARPPCREHAPDEGGDPACALRAAWCEAKLDRCEHERDDLHPEFPEAEGIERPEAWTEAVTDALAQCDIDGVALEFVECSSYPCVATLRPRGALGERKGIERERDRLTKAVRRCAPLRAAFGGGQVPDDALDIYAHHKRCPDGRTDDFFVLAALDPAGPAYELHEADDRRSDLEVMAWVFRRADDLTMAWSCE